MKNTSEAKFAIYQTNDSGAIVGAPVGVVSIIPTGHRSDDNRMAVQEFTDVDQGFHTAVELTQ